MINDDLKKKSKALVDANKNIISKIDDSEITLEQLESLCYGNTARPRGCDFYSSEGDNDDVLF